MKQTLIHTLIMQRLLKALGLAEELVEGALRIGLGKFTTDDEIDQAAQILSLAVQQIRNLLCVST
ncbi:hypothetical protein [Leptolyngbya sp. FACHB-711]|uniref:hypothetical protein n=1 Tax=Leptolyngbya sp. FACHB-711 TaxID=2692813 RepID=UPI00168644B7|nr:hypothetical protein [Leptolyngbya sp. FACHB-711]MBD2028170.1 hypothetical protein [Leptolyngbya sp. FACHB-711]